MKFWSNIGQIRHWVSRKSAKNATLLERTHHRDKLFVTHLIKSGYQLLLTWMRTFTLKSKILRCIFTRSASRLYCSVFMIYNICVFLPNSNTIIITYYHFSGGNFKKILENLISICAYLDFEFITFIFMKCRCHDRYLKWIQLRHTKNPHAKNSSSLL